MRRSLALLISLLIIAGCSKPAPVPTPPLPKPEEAVRPAPATESPGTPQSPITPAPSTPTPSMRQDLPVTTIYRDIAAGYGQKPAVRAFQSACTPTGYSSPLLGEIRSLNWAPYPGLAPTLWVPVVTFQLCNPGGVLPNGSIQLQTTGSYAFESREWIDLPTLTTDAGTGWLQVYLPVGLPEGLWRLLEQRALPWPEITVTLSYRTGAEAPYQPLTQAQLAVPSGQKGVSIADWSLPANPTPELLRAADWTSRRMEISGTGSALFLYSSAMSFQVLDLIGCNPPGGLGVSSPDWTLWSLQRTGALRNEGSVGGWAFQGSYTWSIEERPSVRSTFLLLNQPSQCHFPGGAAIWQYEPATGALVRPTITVGTVDVPAFAPSLVIEPNGGLNTYDLRTVGGEAGPWTKVTYQWDPTRHNWSLPNGPTGAPSSPGSVYATKP